MFYLMISLGKLIIMRINKIPSVVNQIEVTFICMNIQYNFRNSHNNIRIDGLSF